MNLFKIILSIILALMLCFIPAFIWAGLEPNQLTHSYKILNAIIVIVAGTLFVFLSGVFGPKPKKQVVLIASGVCIIFAGQAIIRFAVFDPANFSLTTNYFILLIGMIIGLLVSYFVFKNKGWNPS